MLEEEPAAENSPANSRMIWEAQPRQERFLREVFSRDPDGADEILYGGAAGGGKTDALLIAGIGWCAMYPGAWVLFLRRTYPELEQRPIPRSKELIPPSAATYNETKHRWVFKNGSVLQFGSLDRAGDETRYQSAEYSLIIWDELTHFQEYQYLYMLSRNRTTHPGIAQPKVIAGTNPGNVGHVWVRSRWIDPSPPETVWEAPVDPEVVAAIRSMGMPAHAIRPRRRLFVPAKVTDNQRLLEADPGYIMRLASLPGDVRRMLMDGDWDVFAGQYFSCWRRDIHVVEPFVIPRHWRRFCSLDYGLDMTACYWWAVDQSGRCYIYRELYQPDLILSAAARRILEMTPQDERAQIEYIVASPDLWNRRQDTGKSGVEVFMEHGLDAMLRADHRRVPGWMQLQEFLAPYANEHGVQDAHLKVFSTCTALIRTLPALVRDAKNPSDVDSACEDHGPEAIRYGVMTRPAPAVPRDREKEDIERRFGKDSIEYDIWTRYLEKDRDDEGIDPAALV